MYAYPAHTKNGRQYKTPSLDPEVADLWGLAGPGGSRDPFKEKGFPGTREPAPGARQTFEISDFRVRGGGVFYLFSILRLSSRLGRRSSLEGQI